jgi:hypothetical protein
MLKKHLIIVALLFILGAMNAELLLEDNFTGTVGTLLTENGWTAHSGAGTTPMSIAEPGLTYTGYQSSGIGNATSASGNGEDVNRAFTAVSSGDVYYSFLINTAISTSTAGYSIHFMQSSSLFYARFWIRLLDGNVNFGLAKTTAAATWDPTNYALNTTYLVVLKYTFNTNSGNDDAVFMYINPVIGDPEPTPNVAITTDTASDATSISMAGIRQWNAGTLARFDGIRIGTTWDDVCGSAGANLAPNITNIIRIPETDVESTNTVSVQADVVDTDGSVALVRLFWGLTSGTLSNSIDMELASGNTYITPSDIPAQPNGTTVYYMIYAEDNLGAYINSSEMQYTVRDPAATTIPYTQDFSSGWGSCYTYSVAGSNTWYLYNNDNASCNGYGLTLAEDWLILPAINFDAYSNEKITFNMIATYGVIDANNYLKLMYSPDYYGLGDPTTATWAEIPFTAPVPSNPGVETPSGIIDLSAISGTNVYLAYKYYSTDNPTRWEIDDINVYFTTTPTMVVAPQTLTGFSYVVGYGPSAEDSFTVSGADLTDDITITAPTNYEISLTSGTGFTSFLTVPQTGGTVATTPVYVRLAANLPIGTYPDELVTVESAGATTITVACSGEVVSIPAPAAPVALDASGVTDNGFTANWNSSAYATGYYLDVYTVQAQTATDLFFSEYIEGGSNNKALEIYNGTGADVDLADYSVYLYSNGAIAPTNTLEMEGILANGDVYVIANASANATILALADVTSTVTYFNGDDAIALYKESTMSNVDIFGRIGEDPGSYWGADPLVTVNKTLVRKLTVSGGVTANPDTLFPTLATEWDVYPQDTTDYLGSHGPLGSITYLPGYQNLNVGNVTSYPVSGLTPNTNYYYLVRAFNDNGTSGNSNTIGVTTTGGTLVTPEVSIAEATGTITLSWAAVAGATSYRVEAATDPYGTYTTLGTTTDLFYNDTSAVMKFYRVIAIN